MKLQLKRSNVIELGAAKEPTPEQMEYGELAVNYSGEDPAVFIKDSNDQIIRIAGSGNIGSGDTPSGPDLPSTGNQVGDLFFDTVNNTLFYWNGSEWVPIEANKSENIFVGTEAEVDFYLSPASRPEGFLWWKTADETLYVWYDNSGSPVWKPATPVSDEGGASVTISETPPATGITEIGDLWWDSSDGRLYIYYEDSSSAQWVDASPKSDSIEDAPADGNQYARKDNNWTVVESTGGGGGGDTIINYNGASAWGVITEDGSLVNGLNVASISKDSLAAYYKVVFKNPMPDANYSVVVTPEKTEAGTYATVFSTPYTAASGELYEKTANGFSYFTAQSSAGSGTTSVSGVSFTVFATNALPPKGGTGTDSWATIDKTESNGPCNVPASFNVASVTRTDKGRYGVVFTTPMPTANYSIQGSAENLDGNSAGRTFQWDTKTAAGFRVKIKTTNDTFMDEACCFSVNATNATLPLTVTTDQIESAINNPGASAWGYVLESGALVNGMNIASTLKNGVANYIVKFATPMPDANYSVVFGCQDNSSGRVAVLYTPDKEAPFTKTANGFSYYTQDLGAPGNAVSDTYFVVFATNALPPKGGTGTDAWGSVQEDATIDASFNVASVTRAAQGLYDVVFTTPMPTANYSAVATANWDGTGNFPGCTIQNLTTTGFRVIVIAAGYVDSGFGFQVNCTNATLPQTVTEEMINAAIYNPGLSAWGDVATDGSLESGLNISSTTRTGLGEYSVVFTTSMPDSNYAVNVTQQEFSAVFSSVTGKTPTGFNYVLFDAAGTRFDTEVSFQVAATNALPPKGGTGTDSWATCQVDGTIDASFNVASVTKVSTGTYDVLFTTPMPTANYCITAGNSSLSGTTSGWQVSNLNKTISGFRLITTSTSTGTVVDGGDFSFTVNATNATLPSTITDAQAQKFLAFVNSGGLPPVAFLSDQKPSGTNGGTSVAGWQTRTLNTEVDADNIVTLNNNEFTLKAGIYDIDWSAPAGSVSQHRTKLTNVTDSTTQAMGSSEFTHPSYGAASSSFGSTRVQITSDTTYKIEHYCLSGAGFGYATGTGDPEIYTQVKITGTPS